MNNSSFASAPRMPLPRPALRHRYPQRFQPGFLSTAAAGEGIRRLQADSERALPVQTGRAVFRLRAPSARSVKLAGDFTGWEKQPLDLRLGRGGIWQITVPLSPGRYAYRFLVDGEWRDDPDCVAAETNRFGTINAVIDVN
ncbi:MAG TPA: glycogen-binding domain-containing protein [Verrucomicrobiae bacterium]|nr:glycogen-binding domain-containing protein [Verrucomicrobiae bacterium]